LLRLSPVDADCFTVYKRHIDESAIHWANGAESAIGEFTGCESAIHKFSVDKAAIIKDAFFIRYGFNGFIR
jgi:hypothetical protein